ncbi:phosphoribosylamine--glycine ligase [Garciella nitratireducens]|uniref:phosphoribosylamine--glycine ligase n=1 Tax=Garciella nitratireducens TaxID=218205 RepID=UPI000DE80CB2|nr:phosphoribosylamine--glycine ligase [Garciella nitratireducens]RBP44081.1 phosphoribosylamine--glycine ligase [Garciella nitratireducens]
MKLLVIGSGGREHAIVWKLLQSSQIEKIYCIPGNGGIENLAECISGEVEDIDFLVSFAKKNKIDLTIVGPELPLTLGIVDAFQKEGLKIFGPTEKAACLEGSKSYAKAFMKKYHIPTAEYIDTQDMQQALNSLNKFSYPLVIKADGLAAGKGVVIVHNEIKARDVITEMMEDEIFGKAGKKVVIEEFLEGKEISLLVFLHQKGFVPMITAQDYKRALDQDKGLNTGGMGAISPSPIYNNQMRKRILEEILFPTFKGIQKENLEYRGVLYFGLMITRQGPKVLEYNVRFGDPETQVILPRLESDLVDIMEKVIEDRLEEGDLQWKEEKALTVVLTSGGYPESYEKGKLITGLDDKGEKMIFHSGTIKKDGKYYTNGGRVLSITHLGNTLEEAAGKVYQEISKIHFDNMHYRKDIGKFS